MREREREREREIRGSGIIERSVYPWILDDKEREREREGHRSEGKFLTGKHA